MYNLFTGAIVPDVSLPSVVVAIVKPVLKSKLSVLDDDVPSAEFVLAPTVFSSITHVAPEPEISAVELNVDVNWVLNVCAIVLALAPSS